MTHYRQGDVLLQQVPMRARKGTPITDRGRVILAYGEVTGHAHEIIAEDRLVESDLPHMQLFEEPDGARYLFVEQICVLRHEEHGPIALEPGCYRVTRQREYAPDEIRNVAD